MVDEADDPAQNIDADEGAGGGAGPAGSAPGVAPAAGRPAIPPLDAGRLGFLALLIAILLGGDVGIYAWLSSQSLSTEASRIAEVTVLVCAFGTVTLLLFLGSVILRSLDLGAP